MKNKTSSLTRIKIILIFERAGNEIKLYLISFFFHRT